MPKILNLAYKQKLAKKAEPFTLKEGIMYRMGQDNRIDALPTPWRTQLWIQVKDSERRRSRDTLLNSQHFEG
jgi:hypothetical protein